MSNYILSLKHSPISGPAVWWRSDCKGYTSDLDQAGKYSDEAVQRNHYVFNNETTSIAIPVIKVDRMALRTVEFQDLAGYRKLVEQA